MPLEVNIWLFEISPKLAAHTRRGGFHALELASGCPGTLDTMAAILTTLQAQCFGQLIIIIELIISLHLR